MEHQFRSTRSIFASTLITLAVLVGAQSNAQYLINGDFESLIGPEPSTFSNWPETANAASNAPVSISGAGSALLRPVSAGNLFQSVNDPGNLLTSFTFELDFATSNPGSATARSFNLNLRHTTSGFNQINLRVVDFGVNGIGDLQVFDGANWNTAISDAVIFSPDRDNLSINHLKIVGDYSGVTPHYDLFLNSASALGRTDFHGTAPTAGSALEIISFETGSSVAGSFSVVDNVTLVPEPATWSILTLALCGAATLRLRRK